MYLSCCHTGRDELSFYFRSSQLTRSKFLLSAHTDYDVLLSDCRNNQLSLSTCPRCNTERLLWLQIR